MIIDACSHGFHGKYIDQLISAGGKWARDEIDHWVKFAQDKPLADVSLRLEHLEKCGIDFQVVTPSHGLDCNLLPGDAETQLNMAKALNDNMARMQEESKGRLLTAASIPLSGFENGGRQEMERAINTLGLRAIAFPSNLRGKPLDLSEYEPFWAQAASMNVTVYIHPSDPAGHTDRSYEAEYDLMHNFGWPFETILAFSRLVFSGIMERYPSLKVVSHHLGGGLPFLIGRINETYQPSKQEKRIGRVLAKPVADYFSLFYYDTAIGGSASALKCTYDTFGANQIVFATDYPWGPGNGEFRLTEYPKIVKSLGLPANENGKIFSDNIRRILNLV